MSGRKLDEEMVSIPEVKEIMESVKEKILEIDSEEGMSHFQEITYNYVNKYAKMDVKTAKKIQKLLSEKYELEELYVINIINIDPQNVPELKVILEKSFKGKSLSDDELQEMLYQIEDIKTS
ncbi:MAG: hypothetical protein ACFFAS_13160 [Promethearchaeota archaeon]